MDRVQWSIHPIDGSDEGEGALYALLPDDGSHGLRIGELADVRVVVDRLSRFLETGQNDGEISDYDYQIAPWMGVHEALEEWGIPRPTVTLACRNGEIEGAEKVANRWQFPQAMFLAWLRRRRQRAQRG